MRIISAKSGNGKYEGRVGRLPRMAGGFTLIELLVVIGIIGLLIAMLMPALSAARKAAQGVVCSSNLRQINMAAIMFSDEHNGMLPMVGGNPPARNGVHIRWFGGWDGAGEFQPDASPLAPYWGDASVGGCPTLDIPGSRPQYGPVDYAYNSTVARHWPWVDGLQGNAPWPPGGMKLTSLNAETVLFFDSVRIMGGEPDRTPWGFPPSREQANFHGRHREQGNVGWSDGHVSAVSPTHYPEHADEAPDHHIGTIDDDGDITTDELFDPRDQ